MISSVIARLAQVEATPGTTVREIANHPQLDVGELIEKHLLPITIDAPTRQEMESTTRWLQSREGVEFVDVVFVHFEDEFASRDALQDHKSEN